MRCARRGETKASEAMAEEESWLGWNQVKEQVWKINHGDWTQPERGVKREELEIHQEFVNNAAILGISPLILMRVIEWRLNLKL